MTLRPSATLHRLHRTQLHELGREFTDLPQATLQAVFASCIADLDIGSRQARPELVYRLARQRLNDARVALTLREATISSS